MANFPGINFTSLTDLHQSTKRPGSPSLSRAGKRLRSVEMASVSDSAGTPMSISTADSFMSISGLSTSNMSIDRPPASVPSTSTTYQFVPGPTAPPPFTALGTHHASTAPPTSAFELPALSVPLSAATSASFGFPVSTYPLTQRRVPYLRPVDELMERAESAPAVLSTLVLPETAATAGPRTSPTAGPTASSAAVVHDYVAVKVENTSSCHGSLFSEQDSDTSTAVPALPSSPSSESSFYTDFNGSTPPPEATSRSIQGLNKHELFEVVHPETLREWEAAPGPKVVIFIANDTITKETHHRVTLIRKALTSIFPDADPVIGSAVPVGDFAHYQPVYPFLVHHIPELYARRLIVEHCWTINNFTFFVLDFSPPTTSFVMTLTGLHLSARPQSNDTVTQLVRRWLLNSTSVTSFVREHHDNLPLFMTVNEQIEFTIDTVEVSNAKLDDEEDGPVVFNVYIHPPTNDSVQHHAWQHEIQAITYFADCGTGKAVPLFHCTVCKGRDHTSTSCLFPSNTALEHSSAQAETFHAANGGSTECGERGVHVNGINFNYFMHT